MSSARVGARLWFGLLPDLSVAGSRLVLTSVTSDPSMEGLQTLLDQQTGGGRVLRGLALVDASGRLQLGGPTLRADDLDRLAEWVRAHVSEHEPLKRLRDASLSCIHPDGHIEARFEDEALWSFLREGSPMPGTSAHGAQVISALRPGEDAWFWMTDDCATGGPSLVVTLVADDPDAERLLTMARCARGSGTRVSGLLRRGAGNQLVLSTECDLDVCARVLRSLVDRLPDARLRAARLVRTRGERVVHTRAA